jgi:hypothetical protein
MEFTQIWSWLSKLVEKSQRFMVAILVTAGLLLFLPARILSWFALDVFVAHYKPQISIAFILSAAMMMSYPMEYLARSVHRWAMSWVYWGRIKDRLHHLSADEKHVLGPFIAENRRTKYFYFNNGSAAELRLCRILYIPNTRYLISNCPHTMSGRVWDYLQKHPELFQ